LQIKTKIVVSHTADSKPVKQEVNGTAMLPPLVFPEESVKSVFGSSDKSRLTTGGQNSLGIRLIALSGLNTRTVLWPMLLKNFTVVSYDFSK
jgi:hypothetical protein